MFLYRFSKTTLFVALILLLTLAPVQAKNEVAIPLFNNQRFSHRDNWLGTYFKDRLQEYLRVNSSCSFYSDETLQLWSKHLQERIAVQRKDILIIGSFIKVSNRIKLNIKLVSETTKLSWQDTFLFQESDQSLDRLSSKIKNKLLCAQNSNRKIRHPSLKETYTKDLYKLKTKRLLGTQLTDISNLLDFYEQKGANKDPLAMEEFVKQAISQLSSLSAKEQKELLKLARRALKAGSLRLPKHDGIKSLVALTSYLQKSPGIWVENTARSAIRINQLNETAQLALALGKGASSGAGKTILARLNEWNPEFMKTRRLEWRDPVFDSLFKDYSDESKIAVTNTNAFQIQFNQVKQLLTTNQKAEALELLDSIIIRFPEEVEPLLLKARIHSKDKEYTQAIDILQEKEILFRSDKKVQTALGTNFYYLKQYTKAETYLHRALSKDNNYDPALKRIVLVFLKKQKAEKALPFVERMIKNNSEDAQAWYQKGLVYWHLKQYNKTLESWKKSFKLEPTRKKLKAWISKVKKKINSNQPGK